MCWALRKPVWFKIKMCFGFASFQPKEASLGKNEKCVINIATLEHWFYSN